MAHTNHNGPISAASVIAYAEPSHQSTPTFWTAGRPPALRQMGARWVDGSPNRTEDSGLWVSTSAGWIHSVGPLRAAFIPKSKTVRWRNMTSRPLEFFKRTPRGMVSTGRSLAPALSVPVHNSHSIAHAEDVCWVVVKLPHDDPSTGQGVVGADSSGSDSEDPDDVIVLPISDRTACYLSPEPVGVAFGAEWRPVAHRGPAQLRGGDEAKAPPAAKRSPSAASQLPQSESECCFIVARQRSNAADDSASPPQLTGTAVPDEAGDPLWLCVDSGRRYRVSAWCWNFVMFTDASGSLAFAPCSIAQLHAALDDGKLCSVERVGRTALPRAGVKDAIQRCQAFGPVARGHADVVAVQEVCRLLTADPKLSAPAWAVE